MCGIVGYIGWEKAAPVLAGCLKKLEYRGYDSAGIAVINEKKINTRKDTGKLDEVIKKTGFDSVEGNAGICHCRWATHGKVTKENAHPHLNSSGDIAVVHNGIIENYAEIKAMLSEKGIKFESETDTEVIPHLIDFLYSGDLKKAVAESLSKIEGTYALGIISSKQPEMIIAARNRSPLIIGVGKKGNFIASDVPAIINHTKEVIYLENKDIAFITKDSIDIIDSEGKHIKRTVHEIDWSPEKSEKSGYNHFMLKEIFEQPDTISETAGSWLGEGCINPGENIDRDFMKSLKRIIIVACGTSWHAGIAGEFMIEEIAGIPAEVEYASEFRYRNPIIEEGTLVIAISQSGETADTLAAITEAKSKGAKILSIVNVVGSSIARESDMVLYTKAGPEIGVASTKAFTAQLAVLYLITVYLGDIRSVLPKEQVMNRIRDIRMLPSQIKQVLEENSIIKDIAQTFCGKRNAIYLGRGINYPIALEGALKLKEVSYIHAEGYPAAEMKHGPIAIIDNCMPVVFVATKDKRTYSKIISNIEEVRARGGIVISIATKGDEDISKVSDRTLFIPETSYILSPLLASIPMQLFAYYAAVERSLDPDKPKNLAKSVTVE